MKTRSQVVAFLLLTTLGVCGCQSGGKQPTADAVLAKTTPTPQPEGQGDGTTSPTGTPQDAAGFVALGVELYKKDRDSEAVEAFKGAINLDPQNGEAYRRLGLAYASLGQKKESGEAYEQAVDLFEKKLRRDSKDADTLLQLADAFGQTGEYEKAAGAYRRAVKLREPDGGTYYDMGLVYNKLAKYKDAADAFGKAVELDPNDYRAQEALDKAKEDASKQRERIEYQKKMLEKHARGGKANNANQNSTKKPSDNKNR